MGDMDNHPDYKQGDTEQAGEGFFDKWRHNYSSVSSLRESEQDSAYNDKQGCYPLGFYNINTQDSGEFGLADATREKQITAPTAAQIPTESK